MGKKENTLRQQLREFCYDAQDKKGKHRQEIEGEKQEAMARQAEMEAIKATPGVMKAPMLDPSKNPQLAPPEQA